MYVHTHKQICMNSAQSTRLCIIYVHLCIVHVHLQYCVLLSSSHICTPCMHRDLVYHTATHCNTLQRTAILCNTIQHTWPTRIMYERSDISYCNTLQHTATHCNTLQHTATHCNILKHTATHLSNTLHVPSDMCVHIW